MVGAIMCMEADGNVKNQWEKSEIINDTTITILVETLQKIIILKNYLKICMKKLTRIKTSQPYWRLKIIVVWGNRWWNFDWWSRRIFIRKNSLDFIIFVFSFLWYVWVNGKFCFIIGSKFLCFYITKYWNKQTIMI